MSHIRYIPADEIIGQILVDFGVNKTDMAYRMYEWIENALEIMTIPNYYVTQGTIINIENQRGVLPCNEKYIHSIWITSTKDDTVKINRDSLVKLRIRNNALVGRGISGDFNGVDYASIEGNYIYTSFNKGRVFLVYKGIPLDCNGKPQVPDNAKVKEALPFYIIYRLSLSGYKHPVLSFADALQLWEKYYPAAANDVNWMDLTEYEEFLEMWTNPLIGDLASNFYIH